MDGISVARSGEMLSLGSRELFGVDDATPGTRVITMAWRCLARNVTTVPTLKEMQQPFVTSDSCA
jgi:hypothetical protein